MSEIVRVATKAMRMMLGEQDDPELVLISFPGSSGARVSIFRHSHTNFLYAVKCVIGSRVSLVDEIGKREILVPYLRSYLPRVLWCQVVDGFEVMISECRGVHTLHHLIMNSDMPHRRLLAVWKDVVESLVNMWKSSQHQFKESLCPRFFCSRLQRIKSGVNSTVIGGVKLADCWNLPIVVNGNKYSSISESFEKVASIGKPTKGVVCVTQNQLVIEHDAFIPNHLQPYKDVALSAASMMLGGIPDEETVNDINRFLAILYFGELRFLELWGREVFAASIFAQAVITANELGRNESNLGFQFPQPKEQAHV